MDINSQFASNIYNIKGNLILENNAEAIETLSKLNQEKLKSVYDISYTEILNTSFLSKKILSRNIIISDINKLFTESKELIIFGEPGIGKTSTAYLLINSFNSAIYISIKGKSALMVLAHIINRIRISNRQDFLEVKGVEEAQLVLQSELQNTTQLFIIDDCEQNTEVIEKLITIEKFNCKFLYITRNEKIFSQHEIPFYPIPVFSELETRKFLSLYGIALGTVDFLKIYQSSQGNPLYLFYFSQHQISPLPKSIIAYQETIWSNLSPRQKEFMILIAIPKFSISLKELSEVLGNLTIIELADEIDALANLVNNKLGSLEVFHPSFTEHICNYLFNKGLSAHYHRKLGEYYFNKDEIIKACYLLIDYAPEKIEDYALSIFPVLIDIGELNLSIKLLELKLQNTTDNLTRGYIHYHISNTLHLQGDKDGAMDNIDIAINLLNDNKTNKFYLSSLMVKAMNLNERGSTAEAKKIADNVLSKLKKRDREFKAILYVNLSNIYMDLFDFEKAADVGKEAFDIFHELNSVEGMLSSLSNLVSSLTHLDGYINEAEKYALKILDLANEDFSFTIPLIAMNALTSIYRRKGEYDKALHYGEKVVNLYQKYGLINKLVLNLINYANIIRDQNNIDEAVKIYNEALVLAHEYGMDREKARTYWILSGISRKSGMLDEAVHYADRSIESSNVINFIYGIANAYYEKGKALEKLNKHTAAAECFEESGRHYYRMPNYESEAFDSFSYAINLYIKAGEAKKAEYLIKELISFKKSYNTYKYVSNLLLDDADIDTSMITTMHEELIQSFFYNEPNYNIIHQLITYLNYCNNELSTVTKTSFIKILNIIIDNIDKNHFSLSLIGVCIEQSKSLIDVSSLLSIAKTLSYKLPLFSIRKIVNDIIIVTSIQGFINLEFHIGSNDAISFKIALCILLILHQAPDLLLHEGEIRPYCIIFVNEYSEFQNAIEKNYTKGKYPFEGIAQSIIAEAESVNDSIILLISDEYEINADLIKSDENKSLLYMLVTSFCRIKEKLYNSTFLHNHSHRRMMLNQIGQLLGYANTDIESTEDKFRVDLNRLDV